MTPQEGSKMKSTKLLREKLKVELNSGKEGQIATIDGAPAYPYELHEYLEMRTTYLPNGKSVWEELRAILLEMDANLRRQENGTGLPFTTILMQFK